MNAILIGITAAVLTIPTIIQAQPINEVLGVNFNYTPEQCTQWAIAAKASDTVQSASGGLSQSEFMNFLNSLVTGSDTSITTFGNLPFEVQLGYPALACWCEELGEGEGCCEGGITARINVSALVEENPSEVAVAYKEDFCAFVALVVRELEKMGSTAATTVAATTVATTTSSTVEKEDDDEGSTAAGTTTTVAPVTTTASVTTAVDTATTITSTQASYPSTDTTTILLDSITFTTVGSVINYSLEDPPQTTAKDILDNSESKNGVIRQLSQGVTTLSFEVIEECPVSGVVEEKKSTRSFSMGVLGTLGETKVKDIPCPKGLSYAPENASCIAFTITVNLREALARYRTCLNNGINRAIDGGKLYNIVEDLSTTDAKIFGLGVPGDGVDYLGNEKDGEKKDGEEKDAPKDVLDDENPVVESNEATTSTGLAGGYIFLIILALFAMPVVVFCCGKVNRERNQEEMERVREFAEEPAV